MEQWPPKIPTMTQNLSPLPLHKLPLMAPNHPSSWIDDFLDFSSARRVAHRRSASDSIAFLELPLDDPRNSSAVINVGNAFERLDDEQLMSMFSEDVSQPATAAASSSNTSTPSDQNSDDNEQKPPPLKQELKNEPGEVVSSSQSQSDSQGLPPGTGTTAPSGDNSIDPKRVKRILANRQSAQRSRVRKLQYISELERSVTTLQSEVSALSPRVAFLDHQRLILNVDNSALKQRIAALAQDKLFKDAHQEALKKEIERLRQVYHQQNVKKVSTNQNAPPQRRPYLEDGTDI